MRLTHIKLSGFKSFVDPTVIHVPGQLVAVIGPNGCGKSNVIDAVRWVLGESSARQLRGESMQDVIFNGSSTRKPVARASVELVFDNADGQLIGPWGHYTELAIKRVLTRQGESSYLINNQVVRRRDITDLFLGTGVGARGYAVIEQGMISRIIEARPEELRVYLEETAGVSRYKDRRRETEHRLADTRDNLERIADLRQELARQVERLSEQAAVAAQYHDLHASLRQKQNLLALLKREEAARDEAACRVELAKFESQEAQSAQLLSSLELELETVRESHFDVGDQVQEVQQRLYEVNAALARLEEQQRHREANRQRIGQELDSLQRERRAFADDQQRLGDEEDECAEARERLQMELEEAMLRQESGAERLPDAESAFAELEQRQATLKTRLNEQLRQRDLTHQRREHLAQAVAQGVLRLDRLAQEQKGLNLPSDQQMAEALARVESARQALESVRARVVADEARQADLSRERERLDESIQDMHRQLTHSEARAAALSRFLSQEQGEAVLPAWLAQHGLDQAPTLWQQLTVDAQWQRALEAVLADKLYARPGASPADELPPAALVLLDADSVVARQAHAQPLLLDQLSAAEPFASALNGWLAQVFVAASLADAMKVRHLLKPGESLVTPEGHQLTRSAVQYYVAGHNQGLMAQKAELEAEEALQAELSPRLAALQDKRSQLGSQINMIAEAVRGQKSALTRLDAELNTATRTQLGLEQAMHHGGSRSQAILAEQAQLQEEAEQHQEQMLEAELEIETLEQACFELEQQLDQAQQVRERLHSELVALRAEAQRAERSVHDVRLRQQAAEQKLVALKQRLHDRQVRDEALADKLVRLNEELAALDDDMSHEQLQQWLQQRESHETELTAARERVSTLAERMRQLAQQQHEVNQALPLLREARQTSLLRQQEARLAMERYQEELNQAQVDVALLMTELAPGLKPNVLAAEIARLARAVEGLGAVNLAALDELQAAQTRETYLLAQSEDLLQAIATLESAIHKIDAESRALLQTTFNAVNDKMREFFPTLFGGGRAELTLTGEDLLDAGIQILAQPPGKKNSTIHLLSGGEKALTAMSLVFSLFSLNPAPFCLLDEVDAPLDDANTGRFCELVKLMAERTQFLYISHNRLTMEMAEQLVGVTMQEQGVSRVVAVDIVEALQMRELA